MKLLPLLASLAISVYAGPASESFDIRSDLEALDAALKIAPGYCDAKESRIDALKAMLDSDSFPEGVPIRELRPAGKLHRFASPEGRMIAK